MGQMSRGAETPSRLCVGIPSTYQQSHVNENADGGRRSSRGILHSSPQYTVSLAPPSERGAEVAGAVKVVMDHSGELVATVGGNEPPNKTRGGGQVGIVSARHSYHAVNRVNERECSMQAEVYPVWQVLGQQNVREVGIVTG